MPTARPRHQITETDEVARALDLAARRWPGESRGRLLVRLALTGAADLAEGDAAEVSRRRRAVLAGSGAFTGSYPAGYLDELRQDWPE
jgi:hypothetical protein